MDRKTYKNTNRERKREKDTKIMTFYRQILSIYQKTAEKLKKIPKTFKGKTLELSSDLKYIFCILQKISV